jgi:hypothetical protein
MKRFTVKVHIFLDNWLQYTLKGFVFNCIEESNKEFKYFFYKILTVSDATILYIRGWMQMVLLPYDLFT